MSSFIISSSSTVNIQHKQDIQPFSSYSKHMTVYTPKNASGAVSLLVAPNTETAKIIGDNLANLPLNAIIDVIEYRGYNNFTTSGSFDIGLGQLNTKVFNVLIEDGTSTIANEKQGGVRNFSYFDASGLNDKPIVQANRCINIVLEHPITSGGLSVTIHYRLRETTLAK